MIRIIYSSSSQVDQIFRIRYIYGVYHLCWHQLTSPLRTMSTTTNNGKINFLHCIHLLLHLQNLAHRLLSARVSQLWNWCSSARFWSVIPKGVCGIKQFNKNIEQYQAVVPSMLASVFPALTVLCNPDHGSLSSCRFTCGLRQLHQGQTWLATRYHTRLKISLEWISSLSHWDIEKHW